MLMNQTGKLGSAVRPGKGEGHPRKKHDLEAFMQFHSILVKKKMPRCGILPSAETIDTEKLRGVSIPEGSSTVKSDDNRHSFRK
jgi:hypothetical protein